MKKKTLLDAVELTKSYPAWPVALARIIGQNSRDQSLANIIAHRNDARVFRGYLEAFLNGGNGAIEVGIRHRENAADDAIEQDVRSLIGKAGESLKFD